MEGVQDLRALQGIQDELVEQGLMKAPPDARLAMKSKAKAVKAATKRKTASPGGVRSPYRLFTSPTGLQILIGRNNRQNDELSTRIANGAHSHCTCDFC
jgi:predicted ribosome quality control (RQC) complex YloA/Tae2 family protein